MSVSEARIRLETIIRKYCYLGYCSDLNTVLKLYGKSEEFIDDFIYYMNLNGQIRRYDFHPEYLSFHVPVDYSKRYYCAAKLADKAEAITTEYEGDVYCIYISSKYIEEIELLYALMVTESNCDKIYHILDLSFLISRSVEYFLWDQVKEFESYLYRNYSSKRERYGNTIAKIKKERRKYYRDKLNKKYEEIVKEHRVPTQWKNEYKLYRLMGQYVDDIKYQFSPDWLRQQSFDIFLPEQGIAIEYQGKQHFDPVDFFGGLSKFEENRIRDEVKATLCEENGVRLISWEYHTPINSDSLISFLKNNCIEYHDRTPDPISVKDDDTVVMAPIITREVKTIQKKACESLEYIYQYSLDGEFIQRHVSIQDAAISTHTNYNGIYLVINGSRITAGGYRWRRCSEQEFSQKLEPFAKTIKQPSYSDGNPVPVIRMNVNDEVLEEYPSIKSACVAVGVSQKCIYDALRGKQKTSGGYKWKYANRKE